MVTPRREDFGGDDNRPESSDSGDRPNGGDSMRESRAIAGSGTSEGGVAGGMTERLRGVLGGESDGDLLLDRSEVENGIAQWLRALDLQVLGACRADERSKPLLKLNISSALAEDMLVARLGQHFDVSEVGILARCLCVPLVSIRVGKINKQGSLLCPTTTRGHLNLSLLPSSDMCISFVGDDGCTEQLGVLRNNIESTEVVIDEISADSSSRSFLLKLPGSQVLYFWCSEKLKDRGMELLAEMKYLLRRKPSLARLTGIRESRLDSFAIHLRAYLIRSSKTAEADHLALSGESVASLLDSDFHSSKSCRYRFAACHATKGQYSHQGSLSPRSNTFKGVAARSSSSIKNGIKEKLRRREDGYHSSLFSCNQTSALVVTSSTKASGHSEDCSISGSDSNSFLPPVLQTEVPCPSSSLSLPIPLLASLPPLPISAVNSRFSPYYCWCPPHPSSLQYSATPHLPTSLDGSMLLPPLSSLFVASPPVSLLPSSLALNASKLPTSSLPSLLPESFVRLPIPVADLVTLPASQQISTFMPYMADPIVHTPVVDICSSGQGYLVSAGPAISSTLPPLLAGFVNHPFIPNTESAVERSARETLRMLVASTPVSGCQKPLLILPEIDGVDESMTNILGTNDETVAAVAQGDVEPVARGLSDAMSPSQSEVDDCSESGKMEGDDYSYADDREED